MNSTSLRELSNVFGDPGAFGGLTFDFEVDVDKVPTATRIHEDAAITLRRIEMRASHDSDGSGCLFEASFSTTTIMTTSGYTDLVSALTYIFGEVFDHLSEYDYEILRGSFEPWAFKEGLRRTPVGEFRVNRYGGEAREWSGQIGEMSATIIEKRLAAAAAYITFPDERFWRFFRLSTYRGIPSLIIKGRSFDEVIQSIIQWREDIHMVFTSMGGLIELEASSPPVLGHSLWTSHLKRGLCL